MSQLVDDGSGASRASSWLPRSDDVILVADVDEIVKPDVLLSLSRCHGEPEQSSSTSFHHNFPAFFRMDWPGAFILPLLQL